jgi:DNA-binding CsgD family transcriptional regulator
MKVSGTSLLTRKALVTRAYGTEAWRGLFRDVAATHACFRRPITAETRLPVEDFLAFQDEVIRRFYSGGEDAFLKLGADSARFAHTEGPLKQFFSDHEINALVAHIPKLWTRYFVETDSRSEATITDAGVEFRVRGLPVWHTYFEHHVIGYTKELLELYCANPISTQRLSVGRGGEYRYLLATDPASVAAPGAQLSSGRRRRPLRLKRPISVRELEVLRLVGAGKTNREIAFVLGISEKTVQHHVAHAYDKLGLYSRAGAALWLAERGLVDSR